MNVEEIEDAITRLSPEELAELSTWLADYQAKVWDEQIERDLEAGRLDALLEEVSAEYETGGGSEVLARTQVELQQAKDRFLELIELAASGEEVIISKDREPFVKLSPIGQRKKRRQSGSAKGMIAMADDFDGPLQDFEEYM